MIRLNWYQIKIISLRWKGHTAICVHKKCVQNFDWEASWKRTTWKIGIDVRMISGSWRNRLWNERTFIVQVNNYHLPKEDPVLLRCIVFFNSCCCWCYHCHHNRGGGGGVKVVLGSSCNRTPLFNLQIHIFPGCWALEQCNWYCVPFQSHKSNL